MFSYLDVTKRTQLLLWKSLVKNDKEKVSRITASFQLLLHHHEGNNVHFTNLTQKDDSTSSYSLLTYEVLWIS